MREKPILFSGPMVRAILDGSKTQTRRVCRDQTASEYKFVTDMKTIPHGCGSLYTGWSKDCGQPFVLPTKCPYGQPGDRMWVRETWAAGQDLVSVEITGAPSEMDPLRTSLYYRAAQMPQDQFKWRPSIHMPRWACRLELEIKAVRVERLSDITEDECIAEGCIDKGDSAGDEFAKLWESINGKRGYGWKEDPWVWVIEFEPSRE